MIDTSQVVAAHVNCVIAAHLNPLSDGIQHFVHSECAFSIRHCVLVIDCDVCMLFDRPGELRPDVAAFVDPAESGNTGQGWLVVEIKERVHRPDTLRHARNQIEAGCRVLLNRGLVPVGVALQGYILRKRRPNVAELQALASGGKRGFTIRGRKIVPRIMDCGSLLN